MKRYSYMIGGLDAKWKVEDEQNRGEYWTFLSFFSGLTLARIYGDHGDKGWPVADEQYFRRLAAKAILFRRTEVIVSAQEYPGYRANIVTFTIAWLVRRSGRRVNLYDISRHQAISSRLAEILDAVSHAARATVTGVIGASVGPFAGDGLDEVLGLAIGLRAIGTGEAVFDAELLAGVGEEFGAIGGAAVGEEALDLDAMSFGEADGLLEGGEDAGSLFVWVERGESEAGVIVDGDVEALDAGAWIAVGAVAGGAHDDRPLRAT